HLRTMLDVNHADLRVTFDPDDRDLLGTSTVGRAVELRPLGTSTRTPMAVTVYERDRIVASGTITARVRVRREAAVASRPITPGERIDASSATRQTLWVGPDVVPATPEDAFGSLARSRLAAGRPIEIEDVESPLAVRRGDRVQVHAVGRGLVVRMPGRAKSDARAGDTLEVELMGRERVVACRAEPDGRVVLIVDEVSPETSAGFAGPPRPGREAKPERTGGTR
ncbi:MAG: flagellar basal body P-ring formation chaperone FlgA, partial [Planctomycetota bacterium]